LRIRRAPASDSSWLKYLFDGQDSGRITSIGTGTKVAQYLESRGYTLNLVDGDALEVAARNACVARGPELIAGAVHVRNARHTRKRAGTLAALGILLFIVAAGVDYCALGHRLAALRERRASIRDQVAPILALRDSLEQARARLELLEGIAPAGARFTDVVFDLAMHLPDDAYVTQLAGEADSVLVRGTAENAARAAEALRNARTLGSTQFVGAIRRELRDDAQPLEHFTLVGRLRR
jgi:Tfp pilus assembly protein PilN